MELFTKVDYPRDEDSLTPRIISIEDYFDQGSALR